MPTVAEQLRYARESMSLDIHQVAETTKLKTDHIRALEQGKYAAFTAAVYLRGSLRTYAKLLKLDPVKLVEQLDAELGASGDAPQESFSPAKSKTPIDSAMLLLSRVNWLFAGAVIALVVVLLLGNASYRAWRSHKAADPLKNLGASMYQPPSNSGEMLPLPTNASRH